MAHDRQVEWMQTTTKTADGTALATWSAGPPEHEAVLLLHGFSLDHTTWGPLASRLVDLGFRVIAPDLRGHGQSALGEHEPTVDRFIGDVREVVDAFGIQRAHLVGHSLGAVVVLAARVDQRLVDSIMTVTSIAGTEQAVQNPVMKLGARFFSSTTGISLLGKRRPGRFMISTWFGKNPSTGDLDWIRHLSASCGRATRSAVANATADVDLRPTFGTAGAPTLVLSGQRDQAVPVKTSRRIGAAIDGAEVHIAEDAGHMLIIEKPDFVSEKLSDWITRHS